MFQIVATPFDAYDALDVPDGARWLLVRLARHADREGVCFPSQGTLAAGARKSPATVCRWLKKLEAAACFTRQRMPGGGRYRYTLAEPYRLRWCDPKPEAPPRVSDPEKRISSPQNRVSQGARQQVNPEKYQESARAQRVSPDGPKWREDLKWRAAARRLRDERLWSASYGPLPGEPGCRMPVHVIAAFGLAGAQGGQKGDAVRLG